MIQHHATGHASPAHHPPAEYLMDYATGALAEARAMAIAAHVEPEILLVDEVLSVGDRVFRGRCIDRMNAFLRRGATIVFVSHDLQTVHSFCGRVLLLDRGRVAFVGAPTEAIAHYQRRTDAGSSPPSSPVLLHPGAADAMPRVRDGLEAGSGDRFRAYHA